MKKARMYDKLYFIGPLGVWPWPLLNLFLGLAIQLGASVNTSKTGKAPPSSDSSREEVAVGRPVKIYQLVRDEKGRIVEIVEIER